jgi:hypothetical protein
MCARTWWLHPTRVGRLQARNAALRQALAEAETRRLVWQMSAERNRGNQPPEDK